MKRKILIFVCIILIILVVGIIFVKNRFIEQRIAILTYHGVVEDVKDSVDISVDYFEKQMKWLYDNNYKTITMDEFYKWKKGDIKLPLKTVMIVFDDGWRNNYLNALPILEKYDLNASIFVVWKYSKNSNGVDNPIYINDSDVEKIIEEYDIEKLNFFKDESNCDIINQILEIIEIIQNEEIKNIEQYDDAIDILSKYQNLKREYTKQIKISTNRKREIEKLNNIINELEKDLKGSDKE